MARSRAEKAQSGERILQAAAERIRDTGLESISVGTLMRSVDLTHGGFYRHFASRADLLARALERALQDGAAAADAARHKAKTAGYSAMVRGYLSRGHRDSRKSGCAVAALASDVARAGERPREVMDAHVERFIAKIAQAMGDADGQRAVVAASAMIGGLLLSRIVTDPKRSDEILREVRAAVLALGQDEGATPEPPARAARGPHGGKGGQTKA